MTRTEKFQDHETAIAFAWLKESKRNLEKGRPAFRLTNSFDAIVSEWEESGKLRANHRPLNLQRAKDVAAAQLKNCPEWKIVFDYFTKGANTDRFDIYERVSNLTEDAADDLKKTVRRWANKLEWQCTFHVEWNGENGPSAKVSSTHWVHRSQTSKFYAAEKRLLRSIARIRRQSAQQQLSR